MALGAGGSGCDQTASVEQDDLIKTRDCIRFGQRRNTTEGEAVAFLHVHKVKGEGDRRSFTRKADGRPSTKSK